MEQTSFSMSGLHWPSPQQYSEVAAGSGVQPLRRRQVNEQPPLLPQLYGKITMNPLQSSGQLFPFSPSPTWQAPSPQVASETEPLTQSSGHDSQFSPAWQTPSPQLGVGGLGVGGVGVAAGGLGVGGVGE